MAQPASKRAIGIAAAAAVAGVAGVSGGVARGVPLFTENPGHAQPAVNAVGANDQPYGWFGVNRAKTWEVYRKFTHSGHPNPSPTPDPALEPRVSNTPGSSVHSIFHNQTAGPNQWWNGSGLWFGPAGSSTPTDYQLLISHPYRMQGDQRVTWDQQMDIRVGFVETPSAGAMVNTDGGDGRVGNYSVADFYEGPVGADVVSMYLDLGPPTVDGGGPVNRMIGYSRAATRTNSEGDATQIPVSSNGVTGKGPYAVSSRMFNDPVAGTTFELKFGGWTGTFPLSSLTDDVGPSPAAFEGGRFNFDPANPRNLTPVTYLNTAGTTAEPQMMDTYLTLRGDATLDGRVDSSDFVALATNFGMQDRGWVHGDFNQDGRVDSSDFVTLAAGFGRTVPGFGAAVIEAEDWAALESYGASIGVTVPEPASLSVLAVGALGLLARRRRRA